MTPAQILAKFPKQRALVIGDICLDRWCTYDPALAEPSRETGIPRVAVTASELTPGAGGTIANNLAALGAGHVAVLGVIGDDGHGYELRQALAARGIDHSLAFAHPGFCTFTYTKLLRAGSADEDLARIDFINTSPLPNAAERELIKRLRTATADFDVILVSDQAETDAGGVVTAAVRDAVTALAKQYRDKVFWVDSRLRPEHFRGVIVKPNEDEARAACLRAFGEHDLARLRALIAAPFLPVTHGSRGVLLVEAEKETWAETAPVERPVDICGAGDSFSAGASVAYSITRDPLSSALFGNRVAAVTIMKKGTGTAAPDEVLAI